MQSARPIAFLLTPYPPSRGQSPFGNFVASGCLQGIAALALTARQLMLPLKPKSTVLLFIEGVPLKLPASLCSDNGPSLSPLALTNSVGKFFNIL